LAGEFIDWKIGMFQRMKSNNVALQLSGKCIAKTGDFKEKVHFSQDSRPPKAGPRNSAGILGRISSIGHVVWRIAI
jgi:hypothetical protein